MSKTLVWGLWAALTPITAESQGYAERPEEAVVIGYQYYMPSAEHRFDDGLLQPIYFEIYLIDENVAASEGDDWGSCINSSVMIDEDLMGTLTTVIQVNELVSMRAIDILYDCGTVNPYDFIESTPEFNIGTLPAGTYGFSILYDAQYLVPGDLYDAMRRVISNKGVIHCGLPLGADPDCFGT